MEFQEFTFGDIRHIVLSYGFLRTKWLSFHDNTDSKARAALYHLERLHVVYDSYLADQPLPDAQTVIGGVDHPYREIAFFEFIAVATNLASCFDSALQEVNCACRLGLSATKQEGQPYVGLSAVMHKLKELHPDHPVLALLEGLKGVESEPVRWFIFLNEVRNTGLHADIYSGSTEGRDLPKTFERIEELGRDRGIKTKEDLKDAIKRDVTIKVGNEKYFMLDTVEWLKNEVIAFVENMQKLLMENARPAPG